MPMVLSLGSLLALSLARLLDEAAVLDSPELPESLELELLDCELELPAPELPEPELLDPEPLEFSSPPGDLAEYQYCLSSFQ